MLHNDFLCKLANNVKDLHTILDEKYPSIIINEHEIIKTAQRMWITVGPQTSQCAI